MNRLHPHDLRAIMAAIIHGPIQEGTSVVVEATDHLLGHLDATARRLTSPGLKPLPVVIHALPLQVAQVDRLKSALDLEARARVAAAEMAHDAKQALDEALESIQSLEARLEVEARTTWSLLSYLADLRFALGDDGRRMQDELLDYCRDLRSAKDVIQAALGNGADEDAWRPGEHWADAAARKIRAALETPCTR